MLKDKTIFDRCMARVRSKVDAAQARFQDGRKVLEAKLDDELDSARRRHFDAQDKLIEECVDEVFKS